MPVILYILSMQEKRVAVYGRTASMDSTRLTAWGQTNAHVQHLPRVMGYEETICKGTTKYVDVNVRDRRGNEIERSGIIKKQCDNMIRILIVCCILHTYHSRFIPEGVAKALKLLSYEEHCRRDRRQGHRRLRRDDDETGANLNMRL
jgi:hypothetical protein